MSITPDISTAHAILRHFRMEITSGKLPPGTVMQHPGDVAAKWGTYPEYVRRVYRVLVTEGHLASGPHRRPVVRERPGGAPLPHPASEVPVAESEQPTAARLRLHHELRTVPREGVMLSEHVADALRRYVTSEQVGKGEKLPAAREVARLAECSDTPVGRAYQILEEEGLVERVYGLGWWSAGSTP